MKSLKKLAASSAVTIAALVLAVALLGYSTIGGARAALTYYSENYINDIQLREIGVSLYENGTAVATGSAIQTGTIEDNTNNENDGKGLLSALKEDFHPGVKYEEELKVHNATGSGSLKEERITQYVRVTITRYWMDAEGHRMDNLDPAYIHLFLDGAELTTAEGADALARYGWLEDTGARTAERMVLYYRYPVNPVPSPEPGADPAPNPAGSKDYTLPFADTFMIDGRAATDVIETEQPDKDGNGTIVTRTYLYDDATFYLDIRVDAVQNRHAADAMLSAWGRTAAIDEATGILTEIK